jgi:hypothetical protein
MTAPWTWCSQSRRFPKFSLNTVGRWFSTGSGRVRRRTIIARIGPAQRSQGPLFRKIGRGTGKLTRTVLPQANAYAMIRRRDRRS